MATITKPRKPLRVTIKNAAGKPIEAIVPGGVLPKTDPFEEMAKLLKSVHGIQPTPLLK